VRDVIALQVRMVMDREQEYLKRLNSFAGLRQWAKALVQLNSLQSGKYGCALGAMASECASRDEEARLMGRRRVRVDQGRHQRLDRPGEQADQPRRRYLRRHRVTYHADLTPERFRPVKQLHTKPEDERRPVSGIRVRPWQRAPHVPEHPAHVGSQERLVEEDRPHPHR
jgi:hypothetical protein